MTSLRPASFLHYLWRWLHSLETPAPHTRTYTQIRSSLVNRLFIINTLYLLARLPTPLSISTYNCAHIRVVICFGYIGGLTGIFGSESWHRQVSLCLFNCDANWGALFYPILGNLSTPVCFITWPVASNIAAVHPYIIGIFFASFHLRFHLLAGSGMLNRRTRRVGH